jgi:hypothetical protein
MAYTKCYHALVALLNSAEGWLYLCFCFFFSMEGHNFYAVVLPPLMEEDFAIDLVSQAPPAFRLCVCFFFSMEGHNFYAVVVLLPLMEEDFAIDLVSQAPPAFRSLLLPRQARRFSKLNFITAESVPSKYFLATHD